ncbi:hypothetical protein [Clostridium cellulovorans]|nr:hypothetical protein [Clostridium cellulovorans]
MDDTTLQHIEGHELDRPLVDPNYEVYEDIHGFTNFKADDEYKREKLRDIFSRNGSIL